MNRIVNNIQLTWKLVRMLKKYKTCNSKVEFSKYEFYNKLLSSVILSKITLGIIWTEHIFYLHCWFIINKFYKLAWQWWVSYQQQNK